MENGLYFYFTSPLADEAAALIAPYAESHPQYFGELQQVIQELLNNLNS